MASLEADEDDRQEMSEVAEFMECYVRRQVTSSNFDCLRVLVVKQRGRRFGVIVQSDASLPRSVVLVAPTSTAAARGDRATIY